MFCRIAGMTAVGLLISAGAWAQDTQGQTTTGTQSGTQTTTETTTDTQTTTTHTTSSSSDENRPRLELAGFAGWTFNQSLQFNKDLASAAATTNFYNNVGPRDRLTYGASLGYDVTPNLMIGFLWSGQNSKLELRNFNQQAAAAVGFTRAGSGTVGGGTSGTSAGTSFTAYPVLVTADGASSYSVGNLDVNNFHGIAQWNFGPTESIVRPFLFGGAGVTRFGDVDYSYVNTVTTTTPAGAAGAGATTTTSSMVNARIPALSRFSTTWGVGVNIAPTRGLGIRIAGRWTPTRLTNSGYSGFVGSGSTTAATTTTSVNNGNTAWWCNPFSGCSTKSSLYQNQWAITGGLSFRF
jgi:hypothetical protein